MHLTFFGHPVRIIPTIAKGLAAGLVSLLMLLLPSEILDISNWITNWRPALFSDHAKAQSNDIAIVSIDDDSLSSLPYTSPIDREFLANLIKDIAKAKPKLILLDVVFDRQTEPEKDKYLEETFRTLSVPLVLAYADSRSQLPEENVKYQADFLKRVNRSYGFVNLNKTVESNKVERIPSAIDSVCAFSDFYRNDICNHSDKTTRRINWLLPTKSGLPVFSELPAHMVDDSMASLVLKDKIVLIGGVFDQTDRHQTAISRIDYGLRGSPGIYIHAQAMQQAIDGRHLWELDSISAGVLVFLLAIIGAFIADVPHLSAREGWIMALFSAGLIAADVAMYKFFSVLFISDQLVFALNMGIFISVLWRWLLEFYSEKLLKKVVAKPSKIKE